MVPRHIVPESRENNGINMRLTSGASNLDTKTKGGRVARGGGLVADGHNLSKMVERGQNVSKNSKKWLNFVGKMLTFVGNLSILVRNL